MKLNAYVVVFGLIGLVVAAAGLSALTSYVGPTPGTTSTTFNISGLRNHGPAPDFQGIAGWINSPPLNMSGLSGKVVLVDFWTYSCINCIRTLPYLNAWHAKYGNSGLVIVGVHTPEFQFEKNYSNVLAAVKSFGIKYPVALDSGFATWNAYGNRYWPADYLVDKNGDIRETHFGEGGYNATEMLIRGLLQDAGYSISPGTTTGSVNGTSVDFSQIGTPEIYLGYSTSRQPIGNTQGFSPGQVASYNFTGQLQKNTAYFSGRWYSAADRIIASGNDSKLFLVFKAKYVNIVAQGNDTEITVRLDGNAVSGTYLGSDLTLQGANAVGHLGAARLYNLIAAPSYDWHTLEIDARPGSGLYTFTFG